MLLEYFERLNQMYPPPEGCRHSITYEGGFLKLGVWKDGEMTLFTVTEDEFDNLDCLLVAIGELFKS